MAACSAPCAANFASPFGVAWASSAQRTSLSSHCSLPRKPSASFKAVAAADDSSACAFASASCAACRAAARRGSSCFAAVRAACRSARAFSPSSRFACHFANSLFAAVRSASVVAFFKAASAAAMPLAAPPSHFPLAWSTSALAVATFPNASWAAFASALAFVTAARACSKAVRRTSGKAGKPLAISACKPASIAAYCAWSFCSCGLPATAGAAGAAESGAAPIAATTVNAAKAQRKEKNWGMGRSGVSADQDPRQGAPEVNPTEGKSILPAQSRGSDHHMVV